MQDDVVRQARAWLAEDPDPDTRAELDALLAAVTAGDTAARAELADRFSAPLRFGTAGLRGALGAGPNRMNRAVVIRAAAGLAAYLKDVAERPGDEPGLVVIGYDARHKSRDFAEATAAVMVGAGLRAALLPHPLPTPVLAFAVRHLGAVAGVAVTASHNPPQDNGYKVYLGDGSQIVPPADAAIAERIAAVGPLAAVPLAADGWQVLPATSSASAATSSAAGPGVADAAPGIVDAYLERTAAVVDPGSPRDVSVVYTPLHGVGRSVLAAAFARAGFPTPTVVAEQAEPDPDFPTVAFPNPEEPGAMDLAFRTAEQVGPDLIIANDPDADRCAVAVPEADGGGGWRMLRGDEVGALLGVHLVGKRAEGAFATTIVSSSLLARIAEAAGLPYGETLTGFKWIARVPGLRYGYEEALGYCVDPEGVQDKDGISAALLVAELAAELKRSGRTLLDLLDDIALEYGLHATDQLSVRVTDLGIIQAAMERLRDTPPTALGGLDVIVTDDLAKGVEGLPPTDGLRYRMAGAEGSAAGAPAVREARVVVRPSGTEPKLKCYLEVVVPVADSSSLPSARLLAAETLDALKRDLAAAAGL
ncbi:phospho-sugar mutase [Allostreptomyces psammosilenae]|uniref:Phosphomannomutase n=1 Tax=Allostreptomyces psammosilenae TaxID=1892865 RepID=A0A853A0V5_9ACTN|nr:phospho-sugar mutase [Allostreptomyces psammosilenae]NYI08025.1 phosphomannomutase [Allostreptomyces psammosilenae]